MRVGPAANHFDVFTLLDSGRVRRGVRVLPIAHAY